MLPIPDDIAIGQRMITADGVTWKLAKIDRSRVSPYYFVIVDCPTSPHYWEMEAKDGGYGIWFVPRGHANVSLDEWTITHYVFDNHVARIRACIARYKSRT